MVASIFISLLVSILIPINAFGVSANELKDWAGTSDQETRARHERIKASDLSSIYHRTRTVQRRVYYKKPDGGRLVGYVLPNGKVSPAFIDNLRKESPGCLASDGEVYPAKWVDDHLVCNLPQIGIVQINNDTYTINLDAAIEQSQQKRPASKYSTVSENGRFDNPEFEIVDDRSNSDKTTDHKQVNRSLVIGEDKTNGMSKSNQKRVTKKAAKKAEKPIFMTALNASNITGTTFAMNGKNGVYGVPFGKWAKVRLEREVTNADNGEIELILDEPLSGKKKDVDAGTILFANKSFNPSTKRMDLTISRAIMPNDKKVTIKAIVYDQNKLSGLPGTLERDRAGEVKTAIDKSALQVVGTVVDSTTDSSIAGQASNSVANEMLSNESRYVDRPPEALIRVYPQIAYIRIVESF